MMRINCSFPPEIFTVWRKRRIVTEVGVLVGQPTKLSSQALSSFEALETSCPNALSSSYNSCHKTSLLSNNDKHTSQRS